MRRTLGLLARALPLAAGGLLAGSSPALAHEQPTGAEWLMADWMLLSFLVFAGAALVAFVVALRRGLLADLERAKYHILTIPEIDFDAPEWARTAKEEDADAQR